MPNTFTAHALCFDLDGTLVHSIDVINECWVHWANKVGVDVDLLMRTHPGRRAIDTIRIVAPYLNAEHETAYMGEIEATTFTGLRAMPTAFDKLNKLPVDCWAIVTSGPPRVATVRMIHANLPMPKVFITSKDVQYGKPAPDPFLLAAQRLGIAPNQCLAFEDAPSGIQSAKAAGMTVIGLATTHAAEDLRQADAVVMGLDQVHMSMGDHGQIIISL